jgi:hypothetical protein
MLYPPYLKLPAVASGAVHGIITKEGRVVTNWSSLAGWEPEGIVLVVIPAGGIALDVFADGRQFGLVSNNVFVVVSQPQRPAGRAASGIHSACGDGFEVLHDGG